MNDQSTDIHVLNDKITLDTIQQVADILRDTANTVEQALEQLDIYTIAMYEVEPRLVDMGIDRCHTCGWWFDLSELISNGYDTSCKVCINESFNQMA